MGRRNGFTLAAIQIRHRRENEMADEIPVPMQ